MRSGAAAAPPSEASEAWAGAAVALAVIAGLLAVLPAGGGGTPLRVAAAPAAASAVVSAALPGARVLDLDLPVRPRPTPDPAGAPTGTGRPASLPRSAPVGMAIPALGMTSAVLPLGLEPDGTMEVPPGAYPAGWYDGSPTPGELGPAVLAAHVDWDGRPGAFAGIGELLPGDEVTVQRVDGTVAVFRVDEVAEYPKDAFPTAAVYGDLDHAGLRLITCGGPFDDEAGDYLRNVVVFARLAGTR